MSKSTSSEDRLTAYERAVCYYSLPRQKHPVTFVLIVAYGVCFLEALGALIYGCVSGAEVWRRWGTITLVASIIFGIAAFFRW